MTVHDICGSCGKFVPMLPNGGRLKCPECGATNRCDHNPEMSSDSEISEEIPSRTK